MSTSVGGRAAVVVALGYWDTQSGAPDTEPGAGKYRADSWAAPALVAISTTDADGYARALTSMLPGDQVLQLAPNDSQNLQLWTVTAITDMGTWVQLAVVVAETGTAFVAPGSNQSRLLEVLRSAAEETPPPVDGLTWEAWAPPLDPPTAGGLPLAVAEAIAASTWEESPHLCAALQWEAYAAMLPPTPAVSQVATGSQSVAYSPATPTGDYGLALQRAAWHRSFVTGVLTSVPLVVPPSTWRSHARPGVPPAGWWEVSAP